MKSVSMMPTLFLFSFADQGVGLAGELGFEPRFSESESDVLPLNYSPTGLGRLSSLPDGPDMGQFGQFYKCERSGRASGPRRDRRDRNQAQGGDRQENQARVSMIHD